MKRKKKRMLPSMHTKRIDLAGHQARLNSLPPKESRGSGWWLLLGLCLALAFYLFTKLK